MNPITIAIFCLTDDPFDPPGYGGHGGSHKVMFDMGRHFVRSGANIIYVTRLNDHKKNKYEQLGPSCSVIRLEVAPPKSIAYYKCINYKEEFIKAVKMFEELDSNNIDRLVSYNWISGEIVLQCYPKIIPHIHCVLALGCSRLEAGEPKSKITKDWIDCERRVFLEANSIVTCAQHEKNDLIRHYPSVDQDKIHCIPLGVDLEVFEQKPGSPHNSVCRETSRFSKGVGNTY